MKKTVLILAALIVITGMPALSYAENDQGVSNKMFGKVLKVEGVFILVMDKEGRTHKFHLDKTTRLNGKIKAGMAVVIESSNSGHAISISTHDSQE